MFNSRREEGSKFYYALSPRACQSRNRRQIQLYSSSSCPGGLYGDEDSHPSSHVPEGTCPPPPPPRRLVCRWGQPPPIPCTRRYYLTLLHSLVALG